MRKKRLSDMEFLQLILIVCFLVGTHARTASSEDTSATCPEGCLCKSKKVDCLKITQTSWVDFLRNVQKDTEAIIIRDTTLVAISLPDTTDIPIFDKMKYLRITNCNITVIGPKAFRVFTDLKELHLDSNSIQELDAKALYSLSSLQLLNLRQNVITELHKDTFQTTGELQILDLSYNRVNVLYPGTFQSATELKTLNFTKNNVAYIHPNTFQNLSSLHSVDLNHNQLQVLHKDTFQNLSNLTQVTASNNPWSCDCGLQWLHPANNKTHPFLRSLRIGLKCHSPPELKSVYFSDTSLSNITCSSPQIETELQDVSFLRLDTKVLRCDVTGYPTPSVYWITPHGVLAVPQNRKWMSPEIVSFEQSHDFIGIPTYHESNLIAHEDGSLMVHQVRHYFAGRYMCVAENPAGVTFSSFNITVHTVIPFMVHFSMVIGGITAACFLVLCAVILSIRQIVYYTLEKRHLKLVAAIEDAEEARQDSPASSKGSWYGDYSSQSYITPYDSPLKCTTPVEPQTESEQREGKQSIKETLEDARSRLRHGMERSVYKIRSGAHQVTQSGRQYMNTIKSSSSHYMQTIRESSSVTIHNLRSSSSQYANRMRAGMVLGVEQVKYHVQSMRELCLTGNIGQTISTVSVATDVDSQERSDVVKKVTYV